MSILCLTARRIKRKLSRSKPAKMVLNVDLNELSAEARQAEESATPAEARQPEESAIPVDQHPPTDSGLLASPITADAIDDEVILLTASEWPPEVRNQQKRKRPATSVIDENLETNAEQSALGLYSSNPPQTLHMEEFLAPGFAVDEPVTTLHPDCQQTSTTSSTGISKMKALQPIPEPLEGASSSINEGTLICAVCMCRLNEPVSTNCGHVFCGDCIEKVLQKQKKCPTCRKKLTKRSYHRIYLPSS